MISQDTDSDGFAVSEAGSLICPRHTTELQVITFHIFFLI